MIELTPQQRQELTSPEPVGVDPETHESYVLVPKAMYERLRELLYDDTPWTGEEMDLLAAEVDAMLDDDMARSKRKMVYLVPGSCLAEGTAWPEVIGRLPGLSRCDR